MRTAVLARLAEARASRRRRAIADAMLASGVEEAWIEDEAVRLSGRGLMRRWLRDLRLREAGRGSA